MTTDIDYCTCCKKPKRYQVTKLPDIKKAGNVYKNHPYLKAYQGKKICGSCRAELERYWIKSIRLDRLPLIMNRGFVSRQNKTYLLNRLKQGDVIAWKKTTNHNTFPPHMKGYNLLKPNT